MAPDEQQELLRRFLRGEISQEMYRELKAEPVITNSIGMTLKLIRSGTFLMGCEGRDEFEEPVHEVTISQPFYLGVCPVTQAEYEQAVGSNPSCFKGPDRPVERVSWDGAQAFLRALSEREGVEYRLPTEAEWEYACRAGSTTEYCFGDSEAGLDEYAWFDGNSGKETHAVGQKKPNAWGLYDMHGNVWEWCQDWSWDYDEGPQTDPRGPSDGDERALRGGSWSFPADHCRSAYRLYNPPDWGEDDVGFRVARPLR